MTSLNWLARYRNGEREQVWDEFRRLGARVRGGTVEDEAREVCDEMALRARSNVEVIVERLAAQGFVFHSNDDDRVPVEPFLPASPAAVEVANRLEAQWGPVPLVLSSWMRLVGDVWLVGTHPAWEESDAADPLVIELQGLRYPDALVTDYWASERELWDELIEGDPAHGGFVLPVAPDRLHKSNVSGGEPYGFRLPDGGVDATFVADVEMSFVSYLNRVFEHGGFPATTSGRNQAKITGPLAEGLLAL